MTREEMVEVIEGGGVVLFNGVRYDDVDDLPTQEEIDESYWVGTQGPPGETGPQGEQGEQGIQGEQGEVGPAGADGTGLSYKGAWDSGTAYEIDDAVTYQGSLWAAIDPSTNVTPTEGADWTLAVSKGDTGATGAAGDDGADGSDGVDGSTWYNAGGAPSGGTGVDGDYYLNDTNGDVYQKSGGSWSVVANIKGATGSTGATGSAGAAGSPAAFLVGNYAYFGTSAEMFGALGAYGDTNGVGFSDTEANVQLPMPRAGTIQNLAVNVKVSGSNRVIKVRKNGVDTAVTVTAGGSTGVTMDTTHSVAFAAGDLISIRYASGGNFSHSISLEIV